MGDNLGDVVYDVWRRGGNVDHIDRERVEEDLRYGARFDEAAEAEVQRQDRRQARLNSGMLPDEDYDRG